MWQKCLKFFIPSLLILAIAKQYLLPSEWVKDVATWQTVLVAAIIAMILATKIPVWAKVLAGAALIVGLSIYFGLFNSAVSYIGEMFKKDPQKIEEKIEEELSDEGQNQVDRLASGEKRIRTFSLPLNKGKNVLDGKGLEEYIPRQGDKLVIIPGEGLTLQIGTGRKVQVEPEEDGNGKINITHNYYYEPLKIYSDKPRNIEIRIIY